MITVEIHWKVNSLKKIHTYIYAFTLYSTCSTTWTSFKGAAGMQTNNLMLQVGPIDISEQRYMGEFIYMIYYIEMM